MPNNGGAGREEEKEKRLKVLHMSLAPRHKGLMNSQGDD